MKSNSAVAATRQSAALFPNVSHRRFAKRRHAGRVGLLLGFFILHSSILSARAQNTVFTYQGQVLANGSAFTGAGQFQFALVTSTNNNQTATGTANAPSGGYITGYNVVNGGSGYVSAPAVTVAGGGGAGAAATANLTGGVVTGISVANTGNGGYTSAPTVTIAPPPPAITYTTYWSNDGTSVNGSEPAASVSVAVTNGLFTVVLGDTTQPNMAPISTALFTQPDLQLRIWFNDGTHGFAALNPAQNLTPAPYAVYAANAGNAGSIAASNIVGTIPAAQLPASVITNGASGVNINGTFSGNGAGVTNVPLGALQGGAISWGIFQLSSSPTVGSGPEGLCAADVNGDGHVDLISANTGDNTLTVLTNNGLGVFGSNATLSVGSNPQCVIAADVNGDGHLDLISANSGGNTLTVLTNNGYGVFGSNATLNVGSGPTCVIASDVNRDGYLDLISANNGDHTLTVLTNNGHGVFGFNATLNMSNSPQCVIAADVNGDGYLDLICSTDLSTDLNTNSLIVFTNNGFGVFSFNATYNVGFPHAAPPITVCAADVNGDGHVDLIASLGGGAGVMVLTNNGSGVFGSNATYNAGYYPQNVIAADVNGDGHVDLICADGDNFEGYLTVLTNNGSGVFGFNALIQVAPYFSTTYDVCAADVNGDGHVDLISANANGLAVLINTPSFNGQFSGNGSGLTSLNAANLTGSVPASSLTSIPAGNLTGSVPASSLTSIPAGNLTGSVPASSLTSVPAASLTGVIPQSVLPSFQSSSNYATLSGGYGNSAGATLTTVGGGSGNSASGNWATVGGGSGNSASGPFATIPGGAGNVASGQYSFAAGNNSHATDNGSFVWGDGTRGSTSQGSNTFCVLATGGVYCYTLISGASPYGAYLAKNSTAWSAISDRNAKKNFQPVDAKAVLAKLAAIPISEWNYKWEKDSDVPNIGPMAQDFKHAFYPGRDDKGITTLEFDGVELAAIQGLNQKLEIEAQAKDTEIQTLKQQNDLLAERLNELEATVKTITERK